MDLNQPISVNALVEANMTEGNIQVQVCRSKNHTFLEGGFEKPLKGVVNDLIKNLRFIKT